MRQPALFLLLLAYRVVAVAAGEADLPCERIDNPTGLSTLCGFAKPEDLQFVRSRSAVIVSEQGWKAPISGGSISIVDVDTRAVRLGRKRTVWAAGSATISRKLVGDPECKAPPTEFSPHGLSVLERRSGIHLAIVNHGERESVELFDVLGKGDDIRLAWRGCALLPPDTVANDVAIHSDGRLFISNYAPSTRDKRALTSLFAALRGEITGDVMEWSPKGGWRHLADTGGAMPNGIVIDEKRNRLFVAELGKQRVVEFEIKSDGSVTRRGEFAFRDMADDLNWTMRGTILVGGQVRKAPTQWSVAEIDPKAGTVRSLFEERSEIHSVTTATDVGDGIVFGSTGDQRIAIARWPH
ncbi:MAG TPA: SMP-30/gluconolactonase/LRE family protein [Steroidobacteraceae bacterium]|jgi:hypothetical protein|nr:SMP-30/gluconolactonase/LRE family protein [Steroidobacteraceae bacterium]